MSADVINAAEEPLVFTVHGVNWHLDVPINEYNSQFDEETQAYEAASVALYVFKGEDRGLFIVMDEGEEEPLLGPTMIVAKRNTDPTQGYVPFTHEILANCGFYGDSVAMEKVLNEDLQSLDKTQIENKHAREQLDAQLKKLKKSLGIKKPKQ